MQRWLITYIRNCYNFSPSIEKISIGMSAKDANVPSRLYKYRHFCSDHKDALQRGVLFAARLGLLNDKFEASNILNFKPPEKSEYASRLWSQVPDEVLCVLRKIENDRLSDLSREGMKGFKLLGHERTKVICLSESKDIEPMWAKYADNDCGFCIEYDFEKLNSDLYRRVCLPVLYSKKVRNFSGYIRLDRSRNALFGHYACSIKHISWSHEREWRMVFSIGDIDDSHQYIMPKPSAIFLGSHVSPENENWMIVHCRNKQIKLWKRKILPNSFQSQYLEII